MDSLGLMLVIAGCFSLYILFFLLMIFSVRDSSYNTQEETKEIRHVEHDAEYNKLIEQYGRVVVYKAELEYIRSIESSLSFADMCEVQNEKLKKREAEIKRIKSLPKEELELYLLQEEAIKQIKLK